MAGHRARAIHKQGSETVTKSSRRQVLKVFVAGAAMAATSTSFLDAAFGAADSGAMALAGGGSLLVYRRDSGWVGIVIDPVGERIPEPNGWVVIEGGRLIGLENGLVVDGTTVGKDWTEHKDVIVFKQDGSPDQYLSLPLWARGPVLQSQAPLWERALGQRTIEQPTPTIMPEITPTIPGVITPSPGQGVSPPAAPAPRTTR